MATKTIYSDKIEPQNSSYVTMKAPIITKHPIITVWSEGDYRDGEIKTSKSEFYQDSDLYYEQRFDWNADFSVSKIEIKDDISGLWVKRVYTWTLGIPTVVETVITAWTI